MAQELQLTLLGGLRITRDGTPVTGLASRKAEALLVYLACTQQVHPREVLATMFWDERSQPQAMANLRVLLSSLRRHLGPYVLITRHTVAFDRTSPYWLDVEVFSRYIHQVMGQRIEEWSRQEDQPLHREHVVSLAQAVQLYGGDFLAGFYVRDSRDFEAWVVLERERLRRMVTLALERLVAWHLNQRDFLAAIEDATRMLSIDPLREEMHRQLMLALARSGQRSAALAQYETCRQVLAQELGVEPTEETQALYRRLQRVPKQWHSLPPQPTSFVGREQELAAMGRYLADPNCRLLTVVGPGGIGKTRLALQAAMEQTHAFLHGVHFVPLAPLTTAESLVPAIADALQFSFHGPADPRVQLLNYLREQEMLLILDNFEHLLAPSPWQGKRIPGVARRERKEGDAIALVLDILQSAPGVKLLVTSRERLNLRWEWLFELGGLPFPDRDTLYPGRETSYSAVQLFAQRARQARWDFSLAQEGAAVAEICRLVEGMPLAIELAAAWVGRQSCQTIAAGIARDLDALSTSLRDVPPRHRSVRAAFDHSWALLSEEERRAFRKLSVFRGGFDEEAAARVAGVSHRVLSALVDKSLVRRAAAGRYDMHTLLRQFAAEKLQQAGEAALTRKRHLKYFMTFAERIERQLVGQPQEAGLNQLEADYDNLRAALHWSLESGQTETGLRLAGALWRFWEVRGYLKEGSRWLEEALASAKSARTAPSPRAKALLGAGRLLWCQGEYERAAILLQEGLALFQKLEDRQGVADSFNNLGLVAWHQGDYERSQAAHEKALVLRRQLRDKRGIAGSLGNLAVVASCQGDYERARALYHESLALFRELKDKQNVALSLNNLGTIVMNQREYGQARGLFEESLALFRELGFKQGIAWSLGNLGQVARGLGKYGRAATFYRESLVLLRELGDQQAVATTLANIGGVALAQNDSEQAAGLYREALAVQWELREKRDMAECLEGLAGVAGQQGQLERAARLFGAAEALREAIGAPLPFPQRSEYERYVATVRARLDEGTFKKAWDQGRAMPLEQAVAYALAEEPVP